MAEKLHEKVVAGEYGPRVAASSYLNSAPLIWSFTRGALRGSVRLRTDAAPARCAMMLRSGEVDAALVPVIECQRMRDVLVVPHVCVGSRSRVRSVVLVTRGSELREARRVAIDISSRTSAALTKIIFREFYGREPEWAPASPDLRRMLDAADAALLIGDPAMTFSREGLRVYDLAELWREHTGLGFVFAVWAARVESAEKARGVDFAAARDDGLARAPEIVAHYSRTLGMPAEDLRFYLRENVVYNLDEDLRAGLGLFYELARRHGITPSARPLRFLH